MNRKIVLTIVAPLISLAFFSCRSTRITRATFPSDSTAPVTRPDSAVNGKAAAEAIEIRDKVKANRVTYETFTADVKMDFEDDRGKKGNNLGVNIRMQYDSAIWVRIGGPLNVEGARILITRDSIKVTNKLEGTVMLRSTSEGQELMKLNLSLTELQDLIVGNPVFLGDSVGQVVRTQSIVSFVSRMQELVSQFNVFADDYSIQQVKITDADGSRPTPRVVELTYGDFRTTDGRKLAFQRKIYVEEKNVMKVALDFRKMEFNKPVSFPFPIPASYTRQ
ncbi:DUF4292 domain-containing protein [Chitinophaga deserti]|uniref:DUF4292 domain-containing protein n=1 Tax=Chitinophaga deserti TaxID=2164099 RepID=UPI0013003766|nr:DUF4292 domain-containing protein [Chitinophaga deserti]